jgi:hypothetical protein
MTATAMPTVMRSDADRATLAGAILADNGLAPRGVTPG